MNITLCEDNCEYQEFKLELLKAKCKCEIKTEIKSETQVKFSPNKIIEIFYKIDKYTNIKVFIYYKLVFSLVGQKNNYGSYIMITIEIIFIILSIINFYSMKNKISNTLKNLVSNYYLIVNSLKKKEDENKNKENYITFKNQFIIYFN